MTLSDLAAIGSLASGVAVLVSLIYLGLQVHQSAKHTRALILQGRAERIVTHHLTIANSDLVAAWIVDCLPFDRLYLYGPGLPLHVSYGSSQSRASFVMQPSAAGRLLPRPLRR